MPARDDTAITAAIASLAQIIGERLARTEKALDDLSKVIRGNGQEGLVARVATLQTTTTGLVAAEDNLTERLERLHNENVNRLSSLERKVDAKAWTFRAVVVRSVLAMVGLIGAAAVGGWVQWVLRGKIP